MTVFEFLRKVWGISIKARQARNWLQRLGFILKKLGYGILQAMNKGFPRFHRDLKKLRAILNRARAVLVFGGETGFFTSSSFEVSLEKTGNTDSGADKESTSAET